MRHPYSDPGNTPTMFTNTNWITSKSSSTTSERHSSKMTGHNSRITNATRNQLFWISFTLLVVAWQAHNVHALEYPRITEHPMDVMVPRHDPVTLNCLGEGSPTPTIDWYKDGERLSAEPGSHRMILPAGGLFFLKVVHSRRESDSGTYWCEAHNQLGTVRSRNATLQVAILREEFRLEPAETRVAQGETALMECGPPRGSPEPTISWRKNGQTMNLSSSKRIRIVDGGNLAIQDSRQSDNGRYQCVVRNAAGTRESKVANLTVHVKPFLIRGPQNQTSVVGSSVTFQCRVGGEPLPDVLWRRTASSGNMPLDRVHILEDRSLRLDRVTLEDMGEYTCEADNAVGSVSATGTLYVHSPPKFVVRPKSHISDLGQEAIFECHATGFPKPTVFWSIEGNRTLMFPGSRYGNIDITLTPEGRSVLSLAKVQRTDSGTIIVCSAVNSVGSVSSRVVLAINTQDDRPPPIVLTGPVNQTLPATSMALLPCKAIGTPTPVISWYRDGIPVVKSPRLSISESGTLTLSELSRDEDAGLYTCVASSRSGKTTWSAYLRVEAPTNPNIKFFRAPEAGTYPSLPGKPQIVEKTDSSVTISWTRCTQIGASSLLGFNVEMYGRNDTDVWKTMGSRVQNTTWTQTGLLRGIAYYFVVRAENSHGVSSPSAMSEPVVIGMNEFNGSLDLSEARASLLSGDVVELTNATSTEANSMKLVWEIINGKYVEGFYVYARQLIDSSLGSLGISESYKMMTILNGGGASTCTVSGLTAYTKYEFFVVPFYKSVEGKPSNSRAARTMEAVPNEPPTQMEALLLNASAVYLKWKQPPIHSHNGLIDSYHVVVRGVDHTLNKSRVLTNVSIDAATPTLLLANLTEGVTYTVSVAAANAAGQGPYSTPATLRLDPITKRLDQSTAYRYPVDHSRSDDFVTQPWFIVMLGSILSIMMLSFGAMVFVKRKHIMMKQSSLARLGDNRLGVAMKLPNNHHHHHGDNSFWLDNSAGLIWRQADSTNLPGKEQIADYAPVCQNGPVIRDDCDANRFLGEYSNYPADYVEVSTFRKTTSDCYDQHSSRDTDSPAPYATTTLVSSGSGTPNPRRPSYRSNPHASAAYFTHEQFQQHQPPPQQNLVNRTAYSDTYFNPTAHRINITENKLVNISGLTDAGYGSASTSASNTAGNATYRTSCSMPQTPLGTIRRTRLKLGRKISRTSFGDSDGNLAGCESGSQQEQLYVKVGELDPVVVAAATSASSSDVYMNWGGHHQHQHLNQQQQQQFYQSQAKQQHQQQQQSIYHRPDVIAQPTVANPNTTMTMTIKAATTTTAHSDKDMIYGPTAASRSLIGSYRSTTGIVAAAKNDISNRYDDI